MTERRRNLITGAFVLFAAAILISMTALMTGGLRPTDITVYSAFDDVSGLEIGSPVLVAGVRAGRVRAIEGRREAPRLVVNLEIDPQFSVYKDGTATIAQQGFIGDKRVDITPGTEAKGLIDEGDFLEGVPPRSFEQILAEVSATATNSREITDTVRKLVQDQGNQQAITDSLRDLAASLDVIARTLKDNDERLQRIVANIEQLSENSVRLTAQAETTLATADTTIKDLAGETRDTMADLRTSVQELSQKTSALVTNLDERQGALGARADQLMADTNLRINELGESLTKTSDTLNRVLEKVERGEGTAGMLLNDPAPFRDLADSIRALRNALVGPAPRFAGPRSLDYQNPAATPAAP